MRSSWSMLLFVGIVLAVSGLIHWFLYRGLVRGLGIASPRVLWPLRLAAVLLAVSYFVARSLDDVAPRSVGMALHWVSSVWVGVMFNLFWTGLAAWLLNTVLPLPAGSGRAAVLAVLAAGAGLSVWGVFEAHRPARVREYAIPVKSLPPALAGLRIAVASDLHVGTLVGRGTLERWVDEINALKADLVLLPGDLVDYPPGRIMELADVFARLSAPLGVYATTGNHEYYAGLEGALAFFRRAGLRVLMNERVEIPGGLILAGVEDRTARSMGRTIPPMAEVLGPGAVTRPAILMNHSPATKDSEAAMAAGADLMVSGHTHGGQLWPFGYVSSLAFPMNDGLYPVGAGHQLTSTGLGYWGPPMRVGNPPEILLITLTAR